MILSTLPHTWLIDIDGTILEHNGYKLGTDKLLSGVKDFWKQIPDQDFIILLTARSREHTEATLEFLKSHNLRFDHAIFDLPTGERILINDSKPSGLPTAIAANVQRNLGLGSIEINLKDSI